MAGKTMAKKFDASKIKDADKVVIHNKGLRSFAITDDGKASTVEPGKTYEMSGKNAKLLLAYGREIEVLSTNGKSAKAVESEVVKKLEQELAAAKSEHQKITDRLEALGEDNASLRQSLVGIEEREAALAAREAALAAREAAKPEEAAA